MRIYDEGIFYSEDVIKKGIKLEHLRGEGLNNLTVDTAGCRRDLHVELLSSLLSHIKQWEIGSIEFTFHASDKTWIVFKNVVEKGKIGILTLSKQGLQNGEEHHVQSVWNSTETKWVIKNENGRTKEYRKAGGFEKLPTKKDVQMFLQENETRK